MPTTKTITLYQFDELTGKAKETAREWLRQCEAEDFDPEFEPYETAAALLGITLSQKSVKTVGGKTRHESDIRYSGFYSEGDGASFEGSYEFLPGCANAIRKEFPTDTALHAIADELSALFATRKLAGKSGIVAKIMQSSHYYHVGTMCLDCAVAGDNEDEEVSADEETRLLEAMRDFANWIYNSLREEYEYRLSDEAIDETMEANEYTFTEDGRRED